MAGGDGAVLATLRKLRTKRADLRLERSYLRLGLERLLTRLKLRSNAGEIRWYTCGIRRIEQTKIGADGWII